MPELVELRHATARTLFAEVDHVVAVSQWVKDTLIGNGVSEEKITVCRQGVAEESHPSNNQLEEMRSPHPVPLKIAFFGRLDATKGVDILIHALRSILGASLRLDVFGVAQGESGLRYQEDIRRLATMDHRVEFRSPVSSSDVITTLRNYDLLAVPSQWLETGPLVVLEAFAAGVPVIGSRLGGIAELVRDGVNGILVESRDVKAWSSVLLRLSKDRSLIQALRQNIRPPRTMATVASEMAALYRRILGQDVEQIPSAVASSL
jgi:glycosyltransferase involved in cell wall biosynthesis